MKHALQFGLMSLAAGAAAVAVVPQAWGRAILLWVALSFGVVAAAYATGQPRLLMKRGDGARPTWAWLMLGPYFLLAHLSLGLYRATHRRSVAFAEAVPGLWFSRRLTPAEAHGAGVRWASVLDLAAEFPRARIDTEVYRSLPLLDGAPPAEADARDAVAWIDAERARGPVLVHCALGHGRTGTVVLAWLLRHGYVPDAAAGITRLRELRRGFGVTAAQAACAERAARGA